VILIHRNVPGVIATINGVLADHKANVEAQLLGTRGDIGYVVTDIDHSYTEEMLDQLRTLPESIRLRVLRSR
jgi:D-3-phosphoglycerate dehydrogenase